MTYNEKEIIQALNVIKTVCEDCSFCSQCPLRTSYDECQCAASSPAEWRIVDKQESKPRRLFE